MKRISPAPRAIGILISAIVVLVAIVADSMGLALTGIGMMTVILVVA